MRTLINGREAPWPPEVQALWDTLVAIDLVDPERTCYHANYFTPRPYVDEYNRGDVREGFTFITTNPGSHLSPKCVDQRIVATHVVGSPEWDRLMVLRDQYEGLPYAR